MKLARALAALAVLGTLAWVLSRPSPPTRQEPTRPFVADETHAAPALVRPEGDGAPAAETHQRERVAASEQESTETPPDPDEAIELPTRSNLRFVVRVLDAVTETPISDAEALLFRSESWSNSWPLYQDVGIFEELGRSRADAEGLIDLRAPSWEGVMVRVTSSGLAPAYVAVEPGHSDPEAAVVVRVQRAASLIARVVHGGEPARDVRVGLFRGEEQTRYETTGSDGRCRMEGLPADVPLRVELRRPQPIGREGSGWDCGYPWQRLTQQIQGEFVLAPGEVREATFALGTLCTIRGTVQESDGTRVPGIVLELRRDLEGSIAKAPTFWEGEGKCPDLVEVDEQGRFSVPDIPSGVWWIGPFVDPRRKDDDVHVGPATRVVIPEGTSETMTDVVVHRGQYIEGFVVAPDGSRVAKPLVAALELSSAFAESNETGAFRVGPLSPGMYHLHAFKRGFASSDLVIAQAGARDVRLELRESCHLVVRVARIDATPVRIKHFRKGAHYGGTGTSGVSAGDAAQLDDLLEGTYAVLATSEAGAVATEPGIVLVPGEAREVALALSPGARLAVTYGNGPVQRAHLAIDFAGFTDGGYLLERGETRTIVVPAGPCELRLSDDETGWSLVSSVLAVAGAEHEIVLTDP